MKRKTTLVIILTIFILCIGLTSCKLSNNDESGSTIFTYDIKTNVTRQVGDEIYRTQNIQWSEDNNYFMFVNRGKFKIGKDLPDEIIIFGAKDLDEIKLTKNEIDKNGYKYLMAKWISNSEILLSYQNSESIDKSASFSINTGKISEIATVSPQSSILMANNVKQIVSKEIIDKIEGRTGSNFFEGYVTNDEEELIFRADGFKGYHMDLTTGKFNKLFDGFNIKWSPGRTKISYNLHKNRQLIDLNEYDGYDSESLVTYVYDLNTGKSTKIADFGTSVYFSHNDKYIVFFECAYGGLRGAI